MVSEDIALCVCVRVCVCVYVLVNFMCQVDWATVPRYIILNVSVKVCFFQLGLTFKSVDLSKTAYHPFSG